MQCTGRDIVWAQGTSKVQKSSCLSHPYRRVFCLQLRAKKRKKGKKEKREKSKKEQKEKRKKVKKGNAEKGKKEKREKRKKRKKEKKEKRKKEKRKKGKRKGEKEKRKEKERRGEERGGEGRGGGGEGEEQGEGELGRVKGRKERKESRRAVARERARVSSECCVVLSRSCPLSCPVCGLLCTGRCGVSRQRKVAASQPQRRGSHSRTHRTSCRRGPELLGSILLGICELASAECVNFRTRHSKIQTLEPSASGTGAIDQIARESRRWNSRLQTLRLLSQQPDRVLVASVRLGLMRLLQSEDDSMLSQKKKKQKKRH